MKTVVPASQEVAQATTRHRVMRYVMEHGRATTSQLSAEMGITPEAVRQHVLSLVNAGMLMVTEPTATPGRGAGRPAKEYRATPRGRETFAHAYDELAISALETLTKLGGSEAVTTFFEERFADIEDRFADLMANDPTMSEVEALNQALNEDGFMSALLPASSGEQLCQHHCPYTAVAARFPQLCNVETNVFSRLLHSHVQRLATIAHGDGVCTTHIPTPVTDSRKVA